MMATKKNVLLRLETADGGRCVTRAVLDGHLRQSAVWRVLRQQVDLHAAAQALAELHPSFWLCMLGGKLKGALLADDLLEHSSLTATYALPHAGPESTLWVECSRDRGLPVTFWYPPYPTVPVLPGHQMAASAMEARL